MVRLDRLLPPTTPSAAAVAVESTMSVQPRRLQGSCAAELSDEVIDRYRRSPRPEEVRIAGELEESGAGDLRRDHRTSEPELDVVDLGEQERGQYGRQHVTHVDLAVHPRERDHGPGARRAGGRASHSARRLSWRSQAISWGMLDRSLVLSMY